MHSNLQLCMLSGEQILTHCVRLQFPFLNYTTVVLFSQGVDMIHTSISHVNDRSTQLVKGQHIDLAAIFMDKSKAYIIYISEVERKQLQQCPEGK